MFIFYTVNPVSTHSRPKAAGKHLHHFFINPYCFNTQPPEGGWKMQTLLDDLLDEFQHTAARRRLGPK